MDTEVKQKEVEATTELIEQVDAEELVALDNGKDGNWYNTIRKNEMVAYKNLANAVRLTYRFQEDFCTVLLKGHTLTSACHALNITRKTVDKWLKVGAEEQEKIEAYEELNNEPFPENKKTKFYYFFLDVCKAMFHAEDALVESLQTSVAGGKETSAMWLLERRFADNWAKQERVDVKKESTVRHVVMVPDEANTVKEWTTSVEQRKRNSSNDKVIGAIVEEDEKK